MTDTAPLTPASPAVETTGASVAPASSPPAHAAPVVAPLKIPLAATLLRVAWMSIVLGLFVQATVMLVQATWPASWASELLGKITWSVFICTALAIASAASKAAPGMVGLMGLMAAPVSVAAARTVQKTVAGGMSGAAAAAPIVVAPGPWELAILKGVQYAIFGWLICRAQRKGTLKAHLAVSVPIGVAFAVYIVCRAWATTPPDMLKPLGLIARGVGDASATVGCSVVLWAAVALAAAKSAAGRASA